jgi:protease-4
VTKRKEWIIGLSIVAGSILLIVLLVIYIAFKGESNRVGFSTGGKKIAVIELLGPIYDSRKIVGQFKHFGEQKSIKAIVFRIDSPGGGVAASQEIYEAVKRVRESDKPIVASMGSVAASGGYYVACGADTIMANPGTTTGSIGVIAEFPNIRELLGKIGVQYEVVKSGRYKDIGSPFHDMTQEEKTRLQSWVDDAYDQFVTVVSEERGLSKKVVLQLADGRVFTGQQALKLGLVDLIGDYETAISLAAELGGISGKPDIVKIQQRRITLFDLIFQRAEVVIRGLSGITLNYMM